MGIDHLPSAKPQTFPVTMHDAQAGWQLARVYGKKDEPD